MVSVSLSEGSWTASLPATGVQNSSYLGASVKFTMPFTFSFEKYADMIYVYGLNFCKWFNGSRQLHFYIIFTNEAQCNRDGVNNTRNSHVWADENPHATVESNFQQRFSVNVWCAVLDDQLIGPFILEGRLTGEAYLRFLQEELPQLLEDVPLDKRSRMYFQHDGAAPHSSRVVTNFLNYRFPGRWIGRCGPHHWPARSPELSPLDYRVWEWMKELVYSEKLETRDALLGRILDAADHIRNSQLKLLRATR